MNSLTEKLIAKAIEEIEQVNFGVTGQFLEVHKIKYHEGVPVVARVDLTPTDDTSIVYFNVEDEPFFFVVYMNNTPEPHVRWVGTENAYSVCINTSSEILNAKEMAAMTTLIPTRSWSKGDLKKSGVYKHSQLIFEPNPEVDEFETKLKKLLDYIEQDKEGMKRLVKECEAYIQVVSWLYIEWLRGYHLDSAIIKRMAALDLEIDISQYGSGNYFKEDNDWLE